MYSEEPTKAFLKTDGVNSSCDETQRNKSVLILCGKGNNGGDGLVMARLLLQQNWHVTVCRVFGTDPLSSLAQLNEQRLRALVKANAPKSMNRASHLAFMMVEQLPMDYSGIVIDAIFGTGYSGVLPEVVQGVLSKLDKAQPIFALDLPSGMNADTGATDPTTLTATVTYTFDSFKPAHLMADAERLCGKIVCLDIGIDQALA